jgi:glycogen synthase
MRGMSQDFSWDRAAGLYRDMYKRALNLRQEATSAAAERTGHDG